MIVLQQNSNPIFDVQIVDDTGLPVTGLVAATFPALSYAIAGANAAVGFPALSDLALITSAFTAGGIKERSGGYYRVDGPVGMSAVAQSVVRLIGEATGKRLLHPPIQIQPPMGLDVDTRQLLTRHLTFVGVTTGIVTADTYVPFTFYNGFTAYVSRNLSTPVYIWSNGTNMIASTTLGTAGAAYFQSSNNSVLGAWTAQGGAGGTTVVTARGHSQLAGTQLEQSCLAGSGAILQTAPPTLSEIQAGLFVDGSTNKLKVNSDNTVNANGSGSAAIYVTVPPVVAVNSQDPARITIVRGDTLGIGLPLLGTITSRSKLVFTAKAHIDDLDSQAVIQVIEGTGLTILNGSIAANAGDASVSVTNQTTGVASLTIAARATAVLICRDLVWDVQVIFPTSVTTPTKGVLSVVPDITQAIS